LTSPAVKIKKDFELEGKSVPEGPVSVGFGAKLKFDGTVRYGRPTTAVALTPGKAEVEFEKEVETEYGKVKFKGTVEPGKLSKLGISVGTESFEVEFEASPDLKVKVEFPVASKEVHTGFGNLFFDGKMEAVFEVIVSPNPLWPGWATVARGAAQAGRTVVSAARGLLYAGEAGTATTGAAVATAALIAAAYIAWVGYGLYQIGKAHEKGRTLAIGYAFSNGYAKMLANMTSDAPALRGAGEFGTYYDMDWKGIFEEQSRAYISQRSIGEAIYAAEQVEKAGGAAIFQDGVAFLVTYGPDAWKGVRAHHQAVYGRGTEERRQRYLTILYQQVRNGGTLGIPIT
jgi:hypothetical protein